MTKIIWSCPNCGTVLPVWKMKCSNCHRPAVSWLHLIVVVAVALPAFFVLLRFL
jgi:RNA polymerase subunit RPABC4/transcription elongation factor Spt4